MKVKKNAIALILIISIFGGMITTKYFGIWSDVDGLTKAVQTAKLEQKQITESTGENDSTTDESATATVTVSVEEIRGSSTFTQVSEIYKVSREDLAAAFGLDKSKIADMKVKDIVSIYGEEGISEGSVNTFSVRYFVALYNGVSYEKTEEIVLPKTAIDFLKSKNKLPAEEEEYLKTHTFVKK